MRFAAAGREGTLVVLNGDVLSTIDLRAVLAFHRAKRAKATIVLTPVEDPTAYGLVQLARDGRVQGFLEKPSWEEVSTNTINAGVYVLEPELLRLLPAGPLLDRARLLPAARAGAGPLLRLRAPRLLARHRDLGEVPPGAPRPARGARRAPTAATAAAGTGLWLAPGVRTGERLLALGRALVGPGTELGDARAAAQVRRRSAAAAASASRAVLENCVLWDGVEVGEGARLKGCILGNGARIGAHASSRLAGARRGRRACRTTAACTGADPED